MKDKFSKYSTIVFHAIPSLVAISLLEVVNVQVYIHGPVSKGALILLAWLTLQMIPGFVFGYISDRHYRKKVLVISQILGLIGGVVLSIFGFEMWVLVLIALIFNPMPVARAAFLDNFPQYSTLKLIAITFIAQYIPWAFYNYISQYSYKTVVFWTIGILAINTLLTIYWFKDNYDKRKHAHENHLEKKYKTPLLLTLSAFTLSEITFYVLWTVLEVTPHLQSWQAFTTWGTLIGICIAMFYNRFPHISVITLFYSIGAAMLLAVLLRCLTSPLTCASDYASVMSHYCVIGGLYLPFVTVAVINMFGPKNMAFGSATIEFCDTIASFVAPLSTFLLSDKIFMIVTSTIFLYTIATFIQWYAEKRLAAYKL